MRVLNFGWEFPPKIYGGLAVASYGITRGLTMQEDMELYSVFQNHVERKKTYHVIRSSE